MADATRDNDHVGALLGELARGVQPETFGATGDEDCLRLMSARTVWSSHVGCDRAIYPTVDGKLIFRNERPHS